MNDIQTIDAVAQYAIQHFTMSRASLDINIAVADVMMKLFD